MTILELIRPRHWVKNLFVLLPPLFAGDFARSERYGAVLAAFAAFCLAASAVYALNDAADAEEDRMHPVKRRRPVAAGRISTETACLLSAALAVSALVLAAFVGRKLLDVTAAYLFLNILYTCKLKRVVILDVMLVAAGFMLRMEGGAAVSSLPSSGWVVLTTFFLALFLGFAKRRAELAAADGGDSASRRVLGEYTVPMLDHMLAALMAMTILCYSLYSTSDYIRRRLGTDAMLYTVPFVVFGVFRYYQQVHTARAGESPTDMLLSDRPTIANLLLWGAACAWILYG